MLKRIVVTVMAGWLVTGSVLAQEEKEKKLPVPPQEQKQEDELTPEKIVKSLEEIRQLMLQSEELLNLSSHGREAIEQQKDLMAKIDELLKEPQQTQKSIMEKIDKLLEKSEGEQKGTIDKLTELIKKAKESQGQGEGQQQSKGQPQEEGQQDKEKGQKNKPKTGGSPATKPYDPSQAERAEALRKMLEGSLRWGELPPKLRDQILMGEMDIEKFPPEYRDILESFFKELMKEGGK